MKNATKRLVVAGLLGFAVASLGGAGCGNSGGTGGAGGGAGGGGGRGGGAVMDAGTDGSRLQDCTGLVCGSDQQVVNVRSPALGTTECACLPIPSAGRCADCTCGEPLCVQYFAHCLGYSLEAGLLCSENG
jgi:hypothetical protein